MAFHDDSSQDSSTKKVLDYYEKYSQNSNLPKYFSGSSVQYLPVIDITTDRHDHNTRKLTNKLEPLITSFPFDELSVACKSKNRLDAKEICNEYADKNIPNSLHNSPLESPLDNRKLEWDSGADIGYHFAQADAEKKLLRKCVSLPALCNLKDTKSNVNATDLRTTVRHDTVKVFVFSSTPESSSSNQEVTENCSSQSDETDSYAKQEVNSDAASSLSSGTKKTKSSLESSSNSETKESKLLDFKMTLSYLKEKIGSPGAHSTPNVQDINNIIDSSRTASFFTSKNLNKEDISYQEVKSVADTHLMENISNVLQVMKKDAKVQVKKQSLFSKKDLKTESVSLTNMQNENISQKARQKVTKRLNKKVIELTLSKPISIDWVCSEIVSKEKLVDECEVGSKLEPKAIQTEGIFELKLKTNEEPTANQAANKHEPIVSAESENVNVLYLDRSSHCDSFEYISSAADIEKEASQSSRNKNNLSIIDNPKPLNPVDDILKNNFPPKNISLSSVSKSVSEDIEKQVELLHRLLKSKAVHSNKKKYYIKKLVKDISDVECLDSNASSGQISSNNEEPKKDCAIHDKESTKSSGHSAARKHAILSSDGSLTYLKEDKKQSESVAENRSDNDYLLKFAENERAYQIHWIENEISHLTKLKGILEFKDRRNLNKRKANQTAFQTQPLKTSIYKITQTDGISKKNSEREYVIQTKYDIPTDKKINYCLEGKEYSITDCKISKTNIKSNENIVDNPVIADIKIEAEDRQTNIKVSTSCHICKQELCVCQPDMSRKDRTASKLNKQCNHTCESLPKICSNCQDLKSVCQERESIRLSLEVEGSNNNNNNSFAKHHDLVDTKKENILPSELPAGYDLPEHFNSLQKIFQKCCCTVENRVCNCLFVKKLLNRFLSNENKQFSKDVSSHSSEVKSGHKEYETQTSQLSKSNKEQLLTDGFQIGEIQSTPRNILNSQSSSDLNLMLSKTTQTGDIFKTISLEPFTTKSKCNIDHEKNSQIRNDEKLLFTNENEFSKKYIVENIGDNGTSIDAVQDSNVKSKETVLSDNNLTLKETQYPTKATVSSQTETLNGKTVLRTIKHPNKQQIDIINNEDITGTMDSSRSSSSKINTKYRYTDREQSVDLLTKIKHSNKQQNYITNNKDVTRTEPISLNLGSEINTKYTDIGVQVSVGLKNFASQTSDVDLYKKIYHTQKKASVERNFNNVEKEIDIEYDNFSNNESKITQKEIHNNSKAEKNLGIQPPTNINSNTSEMFLPKEEAINDGTFTNSQAGSTSASISTSVFDSRSIPSRLTCICCKKKAFVAEVSYIQNGNVSYPICSRCYYNKPVYSVTDFQHKNRHPKLLENEQNCHQFCNCKDKYRKSTIVPKGVVYNLIIQKPVADETTKQFTKVEVEDFDGNKANDGKGENYNDRCYKNRNLSNPSRSDEKKKKNIKNFEISQPETPKRNKMHYTLTDYLIMNRPEFIYSAENRRQSVLNSRILREHQKDILKFNFLENNLNRIADKGQYKLFTERQMKDITKRNYQKLPEIQKKLINVREKRLRDADKLICDIFAKKVQKSALKGKWNFPIDKTLTNL